MTLSCRDDAPRAQQRRNVWADKPWQQEKGGGLKAGPDAWPRMAMFVASSPFGVHGRNAQTVTANCDGRVKKFQGLA